MAYDFLPIPRGPQDYPRPHYTDEQVRVDAGIFHEALHTLHYELNTKLKIRTICDVVFDEPNLQKLYNEVFDRGGAELMSQRNTWRELGVPFEVEEARRGTFAMGVKKIYFANLSHFESVYGFRATTYTNRAYPTSRGLPFFRGGTNEAEIVPIRQQPLRSPYPPALAQNPPLNPSPPQYALPPPPQYAPNPQPPYPHPQNRPPPYRLPQHPAPTPQYRPRPPPHPQPAHYQPSSHPLLVYPPQYPLVLPPSPVYVLYPLQPRPPYPPQPRRPFPQQ